MISKLPCSVYKMPPLRVALVFCISASLALVLCSSTGFCTLTYGFSSLLTLVLILPILINIFHLYSSKRRDTEADKEGSSSAESTSKGGGFEFDVFLSFRGTDTRGGFISHLYKELNRLGVSTFIDNENLRKGESIKQLFTYMEACQIFVPILSKNYAESKWCLLEAAKMVQIRESNVENRRIIPVFYDVYPSDVKDDGGIFQASITENQNYWKLGKKRVEECRGALRSIARISGYSLVADTNGNEAELVTRICKRVQELLGRVPFGVQAIGIDSRIDEVIGMLDREKNGVCVIGICGLGGIGKTITAKAVYDKISTKFEGGSFILDVRETTKKMGLPSLQAKLVCDVLKMQSLSVDTVEEGRNLMKQRLGHKRVLIVLDDIDHHYQLDALIGDHIHQKPEDLFGAGSRIIVTTRDKAVLDRHGLREHEIYFPQELKQPWSLKLFRLHAFKHEPPSLELLELAKEVLKVAGGLPLVLVVFGSHFAGLRGKRKWEVEIRKLRRDQHNDIHERLKLSYDGLDFAQRCVFLDISCFFAGVDSQYATYVWEDCGYIPENAISVLQERSLISIGNQDEFIMHDQIRDMGRWIVQEEGKHDPRTYSRLWDRKDILEVLKDVKGSGKDKIQAMVLRPPIHGEEERCLIRHDAFATMSDLRVLHASSCHFGGVHLQLPRNVRWLQLKHTNVESWYMDTAKTTIQDTYSLHNFPLQHPHDRQRMMRQDDECNLEELVVLQLWSCLIPKRILQSTDLDFKRLKVLEVANCLDLVESPNFAHLPSLVKLALDTCINFKEINESIGHLKQLESLRICRASLKKLPSNICQLSSLQSLNLGSCRISSLPERLGNLTALRVLILDNCESLTEVPYSVGDLNQLQHLRLNQCRHLQSLPHLPSSLTILDISNCSAIKRIPDISNLKNLKRLRLEGLGFLVKFDEPIGHLKELEFLSMRNCKNLKELGSTICQLSSIQTLNLKDCKDISALPEKMGDLASLRELNLENCASLSVVPNSVEKLNQLQILNIDACRNLKCLPQLPSSLHILHASNCDNLKIVTDVSSLEDLRILNLDRCWNVVDVPGLENLKSLEYLDLHSCESFGQSFGRRILQAKFQHLISCTIPGILEGQYLLFLLPENVQVCKVGFSLVEEYCIENPEDSMVPSLNVPLQVVADGLEVVFETRRCATHNPYPLFEDEDDCYLIYLKDDEEMQRYLSEGYRMIQVPTFINGDYKLKGGHITFRKGGNRFEA